MSAMLAVWPMKLMSVNSLSRYCARAVPPTDAPTTKQSGQPSAIGARVVHVQILKLQRLDHFVEIGDHERGFRDLENIGAEPRDFLFHVDVRALHDGHDGDQRGDSHGEPDGG